MGGSIVFQWQPFLRCKSFGREIVAKNGKNRRQKLFSEGSCRLVINNHKICNVTYNTSDKIPLHHFSGLEVYIYIVSERDRYCLINLILTFKSHLFCVYL